MTNTDKTKTKRSHGGGFCPNTLYPEGSSLLGAVVWSFIEVCNGIYTH